MKTYEIVIPIDVAMSMLITAENYDAAEAMAEKMYDDGTMREKVREHLASDNCVFMLPNYEIAELYAEEV